jgi:ATP-binding cassette subfamily B protein
MQYMLKILKSLTLSEWLQAFCAMVFVVAGVGLDLKIPDYMQEITRLVQTPGSPAAEMWREGLYMLLCAFGSLITAIVTGFFAARIAASFGMRMRSKMYRRVEAFSMEEINRFSTASLITRSTNDIVQVTMLITMGLMILVRAPIMAVWAMTKIAGKGYEWTLATGIALVCVLVMIGIVMVFVIPKFKKMQVLTDDINRVTRENLVGMRVVRAYNAEDFEEDKFEHVNTELTDTILFTTKAMAIMSPMLNLVMSGLGLAIYWIGAYLINAATGPASLDIFANMIVFSQYAMQIMMSIMMLMMMFIMIPRASVSAKRINEVLDTMPTLVPGTRVAGEAGVKGALTFRHVNFHYPDTVDDVLHDISFTAEAGQTVAFIGSTGSGKTTLINLIPRFFDVSSGEVLVDGVNVRDYEPHALNNKIGYVSQKAVLLSGTVTSNVAYGDNGQGEIDAQQVQEAIRIAQSTDFVEKLDGAYDAEIAQGGTNVSGGQKQRLSIARAIARKPEIYIFDDSFSALDYKTDRALRHALRTETAGVTSIIVAQRIGTIMDADQIIVLDEGKIAGKGTHRELLAGCSVYREIAESQLSEEELGA